MATSEQSIFFLSLILLLTYLSYIAAILWAYLRMAPPMTGVIEDFGWHFFVPCRDEESVITQTLRRLRTDHPQAHVWVIDDDSDDGTATIVDAWATRDDHVHLVRRVRPQARTGKGDALNAAYRALDGWLPTDADRTATIVGVVDADGHLDPSCLAHIASDRVMRDGRVGAAQVAVHMRNRDYRRIRVGSSRRADTFARYLVRMQDIEFRTVIGAMQELRGRTQSVGMGGNGQFSRLSALDGVAELAGEPWHGALLEDYELGLHILLAGYSNAYVHHTFVSQEAVTRIRPLLTQRTRWAQGNIQCMKYLPAVLRSRYFPSSAVLETGYYLMLPVVQLVGMAIWPAVYVLLAREIFVTSSPGTWLQYHWLFFVMLALVGVLPFAMWGPVYKLRCEPSASWRQALAWGFGSWLYTYYVYLVTPRAFFRVLSGRSGWAKTKRNAEDRTVGLVAKEA